jgi:hypothetical protein
MIIEIEHHGASAVALFISVIIYALIGGYLYYDIWVNVDRKEDLKRWLEERKNIH